MVCQYASLGLLIYREGILILKERFSYPHHFWGPAKSSEEPPAAVISTLPHFTLLFASLLRIESNCVCADTSSAKVNSVKLVIRQDSEAMCGCLWGWSRRDVRFPPCSVTALFSHLCFPSADNNGVGFPTNACIQIDTQTIRVAHSAPVFAVNSLSRNDIASVATA